MGWGAINARLNRLVREGAITAFKTNLADPGRPAGLHVVVTSDEAATDSAAEDLRRRVLSALDELGEDATVTVDRTGRELHAE